MDDGIILEVGGRNNNNPLYKYIPDTPEIPFEAIKESTGSLAKGGVAIISSSEPLIHPDIFRILDALKHKEASSIKIVTNGRICFYQDFCRKLKNYENISLFVEIAGFDQDSHEHLTRAKGSYSQTIEGIKNLINENINFSVIVPLIGPTTGYLDKIIDSLKQFDLRQILFYKPPLKGEYKKDYDRLSVRFSDAKEKILKLISDNYPLIRIEGFPLCFLEGKYSSNIRLFDLSQNSFIAKCDRCSFRNECPGFDREYISTYSDSEINPVNDTHAKIRAAINRFSENSLVYVSQDEIFHMLKEFEKNNSFWDSIYKLGYPAPIAARLLSELQKEKIVSIFDGKIAPQISFPADIPINDYSDMRLMSDPKVCQLTVAQESLASRASYIAEKCPAGGNLAILGDDDFMSLTLSSKKIFDEIFVFEIDRRITDKIREVALKEGYNIHVLNHDLRKKMPNKYLNMFDAFYTDSPYSISGFNLFVSRGVSLLKKTPKCHGFSSFSAEIPVLETVEMPVQNIINNMGLFIESKCAPGLNNIPDYIKSKYDSFEKIKSVIENYKIGQMDSLDEWFLASLGRKELMFHFLTTQKTKPLIEGQYDGEIYYEDEPLDFYADKEFIERYKREFGRFNFI